MARAPLNVSEALRDGGIPECWTRDQIEWLAVRHLDLASRSQRNPMNSWRRRWAYTCADLICSVDYYRQPRRTR